MTKKQIREMSVAVVLVIFVAVVVGAGFALTYHAGVSYAAP